MWRRAALLVAILVAFGGCAAEVGTGASSLALTTSADTPESPAVQLGLDDARVVSGLLSEPSADAPEDIATAWLASAASVEVRVVRSQRAGDGALVRLRQVHGDLDVVGGDIAMRLDGQGRVRWVSARLVEVDAPIDAEPVLASGDALRAARGLSDDRALDADPARHTELVVYGGAGMASPRLAYHVRYEDELARDTYRVYVDAEDGAVLAREGLAARYVEHRARVWDVSPVDSELEEVVFDALPADAETLEDADVTVFGCVDERLCHDFKTTMGVRSVHHCEMRPTALPDPEESFLLHAPPSSHAELEDSFAEVQAYHHVRSGLSAFRRWAQDPAFGLRDRLTTIVNMRVPDLTSDASLCDAAGDVAPDASNLKIEENAYFWPAGEIGPVELGDRIVMHQTERTDWAYDGEIVWHELTHAVMNTVTPLAWRFLDERGLNAQPGGLHEGYSDYFAAAITNRPTLAWYGGTDESGPTALNDLEKEVDCGDVLNGEEHDESQAWAGALWGVRRSLRSQQKREMFDAVAFTAVSSLGQFDDFERAMALVLAELEVAAEELAEREGMTADERAYLGEQVAGAEGIFHSRGIPSCNDRVLSLGFEEGKDFVQLLGPKELAEQGHRAQPVPAPLQIRVEVAEEAEALHVHVAELALYDETYPSDDAPTTPEIAALLKEGEAPIAWAWSLPRGRHDADRDASMQLTSDGASGVATFPGPITPGVYHLQLTNVGASVNAYDVYVTTGPIDAPSDDGREAGAASAASGCSATHGAPIDDPTSLFALLALVALFRGRSSR